MKSSSFVKLEASGRANHSLSFFSLPCAASGAADPKDYLMAAPVAAAADAQSNKVNVESVLANPSAATSSPEGVSQSNAAAPVSAFVTNESSEGGQLGYLFSSVPVLSNNASASWSPLAARSDDDDPDPAPPAAHGGHKEPAPKGTAPGWVQQMEATQADENETRKILTRMFADRKKTDMEIWQMMHDLQTYIYGCMESSLLNQAKARSKVHEGWMKFLAS